jgi:hypothetical protein
MPQPIRVLASGSPVLEAPGNVRYGPSGAEVRRGVVLDTLDGRWVQYAERVPWPQTLEVEYPYLAPAQLSPVLALARGDHGDTFDVETPDGTFTGLALVPGHDGVSIQPWPGPAGQRGARVILRFVEVS